jgi:hypothetical protein
MNEIKVNPQNLGKVVEQPAEPGALIQVVELSPQAIGVRTEIQETVRCPLCSVSDQQQRLVNAVLELGLETIRDETESKRKKAAESRRDIELKNAEIDAIAGGNKAYLWYWVGQLVRISVESLEGLKKSLSKLLRGGEKEE